MNQSITNQLNEETRNLLCGLYRDHRALMLATARRYFASDMEAEDAIHDVFLRLAERTDLIERVSDNHRRGYLIVAVKHACIDRLRLHKKWTEIDDEDTLTSFMDQVALQKSREENFDVERTLVELIRQLPSTMRETLELRFVLGYTEREIANIQKVSMSAVSMRITRARSILREILEEEGYL